MQIRWSPAQRNEIKSKSRLDEPSCRIAETIDADSLKTTRRPGALPPGRRVSYATNLLQVRFSVRSKDRFSVPTCPGSGTPSAAAVKDGRRSVQPTSSALDRPRLDGGEHGVTLPDVGTET